MNVPACPPSRIHGDIAARGARIDFSVNVATSTPSWLIDALTSEIANLAAYPDADRLAAAEELIAEYHGVPPDYVMLLAGAAEGFVLLPHLPIIHPTIIHPGFSEPDIIFTDTGRPVDRVILPEPFNVLPSISDDADLVVIGNPTNPTGVLWRPDDLLDLDDGRRFVVVDEAFIDVVGEEHSVIPQVPTHPRLIVLRSLTKTWAIAGLRVGYMVADPDIVLGPLRRWRPHWPIGTLQIAAAEAVFTHPAGTSQPAASRPGGDASPTGHRRLAARERLARPLRAGSPRRPEPRPGPHPLPEADGPRHCPAPMRHIPWARMELFPARRPKKTAGRFPHHRT